MIEKNDRVNDDDDDDDDDDKEHDDEDEVEDENEIDEGEKDLDFRKIILPALHSQLIVKASCKPRYQDLFM